jgi:L-threonylcarbamoyladenylate synthase
VSFFSAEQTQPWLAALKAGHVAAAPAEGAYGYVADPYNPLALQEVLNIKHRNPGKGLITLIGKLEQLKELTGPLNKACEYAIAQYWGAEGAKHGPVTLLLPAIAGLHPLQTGGGAFVAVRFSHESYVQEYMKLWGGPLISTSLNISGKPPAVQASQIPAGVAALSLPEPLPGTVSRIFAPTENRWLR